MLSHGNGYKLQKSLDIYLNKKEILEAYEESFKEFK